MIFFCNINSIIQQYSILCNRIYAKCNINIKIVKYRTFVRYEIIFYKLYKLYISINYILHIYTTYEPPAFYSPILIFGWADSKTQKWNIRIEIQIFSVWHKSGLIVNKQWKDISIIYITEYFIFVDNIFFNLKQHYKVTIRNFFIFIIAYLYQIFCILYEIYLDYNINIINNYFE